MQEQLSVLWGKELGKSVNTDEAAALGAVYRAADLSTGFKVMKFHVKDYVMLPIGVSQRPVEGAWSCLVTAYLCCVDIHTLF